MTDSIRHCEKHGAHMMATCPMCPPPIEIGEAPQSESPLDGLVSRQELSGVELKPKIYELAEKLEAQVCRSENRMLAAYWLRELIERCIEAEGS